MGMEDHSLKMNNKNPLYLISRAGFDEQWEFLAMNPREYLDNIGIDTSKMSTAFLDRVVREQKIPPEYIKTLMLLSLRAMTGETRISGIPIDKYMQ